MKRRASSAHHGEIIDEPISLFSYAAVTLSKYFFPGLPEYYPLRKKLQISRSNSTSGAIWDVIQVASTLAVCAVYIATTYNLSYENRLIMLYIEVIITQLFTIDFVFSFYLYPTLIHLLRMETFIDILSIIPVYLAFVFNLESTTINFLRCLRALKILTFIKTFKPIRSMNGVKRQVLTLVLTLAIMIFLSAGVVQLMENNVHQYYINCQFITELTNWQPSCSPLTPQYGDESCDCEANSCFPAYNWNSINIASGHPTGVYCSALTFYNAIYYMIVTVATVGYGDIHPSNIFSRTVVIFFIITSLVIIPRSVNELQVLLSLRSPYRTLYQPVAGENHVIICGHVNNRAKLEFFFGEFFHRDRISNSGLEYHAVILSPCEPSEDVRSLLQSNNLDSKVTYVMGSALSVEDLKRVRADTACCMFFLCNTELTEGLMGEEDAATVIRALSVSNFNPTLECLVQVLRPEERVILKGSDIDVILCLDEFKTALQARNAVCPGFSTFIENIFHSLESIPEITGKQVSPWYKEYLRGASMELYLLKLDIDFISAMRYSYRRIAEAIYMHFGIIVLGLTNESQSGLVFNPTAKDLREFSNVKEFFSVFNIALIIADDQHQADEMADSLADVHVVDKIIEEVARLEDFRFNSNSSYKLRSFNSRHSDKSKAKKKSSFQLSMGIGGALPFNLNASILKTVNYRFGAPSKSEGVNTSDDDFSEEEQNSDESDDDTDYIGYRKIDDENSTPQHLMAAKKLEIRQKIEARFSGKASDTVNPIPMPMHPPPSSIGSSHVYREPPVSSVRQSLSAIESIVRSSQSRHQQSNNNSNTVDKSSPFTQPKRLLSPMKEEPSFSSIRGEHSVNEHYMEEPPVALPGPPTKSLVKLSRPRTPKKKLIPKSSATIFPKIMHSSSNSFAPAVKEEEAKSEVKLVEDKHPVDQQQRMEVSSSPAVSGARLSNGDTSIATVDSSLAKMGCLSRELNNADSLRNHVIVYGCDNTVDMFISELRRPAVKGNTYHPILIVSANIPKTWANIVNRYNDVYLIRGHLTRKAVFTKINIENAYALILLAGRNELTKVEDESLDAATLFSYLKLEQYIPENVFCSVELNSATNMAVLNATIMKRNREKMLENERRSYNLRKALAVHESLGAASEGRRSLTKSSDDSNKSNPRNSHGFSLMRSAIAKHVIQDDIESKIEMDRTSAEKVLWEDIYSHHVLPVFAAARAFVPSSFESLLVQSFYAKLTPVICEKFVCGQADQTVMQVQVPEELIGHTFLKLFRVFMFNQVLCFGLYRAPQRNLGASLPYVYISPPPSALIGKGDRVYLFGSNRALMKAIKACQDL